jgi:hypothetical protein
MAKRQWALYGLLFNPRDVVSRAIEHMQPGLRAEARGYIAGQRDELSPEARAALESEILTEIKRRKRRR